MKLHLLLLFLPILLLVRCKNAAPTSFGEFNPDNIAQQKFILTSGRDTTVRTHSGVMIHICANSFATANGTTFELIVQEALTKSDILKSGLPTVDQTGKLLESAGMINLITNPMLEINPECPISVKVPTNGLHPNMGLFTMDINNGETSWKYQSPLLSPKTLERLQSGQQLYMKYCQICHLDLDKPTTGPGLGCIEMGEDRRTREWLIKFTRNSQKMIRDGDTLAVCNWNAYKPVLMNSFQFLSDEEINQIFDYISSESLRTGICNKDLDLGRIGLKECYQTITDTTFKYQNDSIDYPFNHAVNYEFKTHKYEWLCWSYFINPNESVERFNVKVNEDVEMHMVFDRYKSIVSFVKFGGHYVLEITYGEKSMLPLNEPVTIIAFTREENGHRKFIEHKTTVKPVNTFSLELTTITADEFNKILKSYQ
jgi:mono/diheme cytochrome c family protein